MTVTTDGNTAAVGDEKREVRFELNGATVAVQAAGRLLLADALRAAGARGTHVGCEHGVCGACTVIVDGDLVRSCLMLAAQAEGSRIETVESLARPDGGLSPLQDALHRHHGLQCGYCTPGVLMSLTALLREEPRPTEEIVRETLQGHLCRCTGYQQIVDAVLDVASGGTGR
jgi:aerobic-type carbon monoxide dehydrogenase small subunit (CoxS/CutS family)